MQTIIDIIKKYLAIDIIGLPITYLIRDEDIMNMAKEIDDFYRRKPHGRDE